MLPSLLAGSLWVLIAAFQSVSWTWMSAAELRAGAEKAEFGSIEIATGAKPVCGTPNRSEPPLGEVEVCRWSARAWEVAAHRGIAIIVRSRRQRCNAGASTKGENAWISAIISS